MPDSYIMGTCAPFGLLPLLLANIPQHRNGDDNVHSSAHNEDQSDKPLEVLSKEPDVGSVDALHAEVEAGNEASPGQRNADPADVTVWFGKELRQSQREECLRSVSSVGSWE